MTGVALAREPGASNGLLAARTVWDTLVGAAAMGLGQDAPQFERALSRVVVNLSDVTTGPSGYVHQGPGRPPVVFVPSLTHPSEALDVLEALAGALAQVFDPWLSPPARPDSTALMAVVRAGLTHTDTDLAKTLLRALPETQAFPRSAEALAWPRISGLLCAADLAAFGCVVTVAKDGTASEGHGDAVIGRLTALGARALIALSREELAQTPEGFLAVHPDGSDFCVSGAFDVRAAVGAAIEMLSRSPYHRQFLLSHYLPVEILPPIRHRQVRIYLDPVGQPLAFISWARVCDECLEDLHRSGRALRRHEWHSGPHLFFNDWISVGMRMRPVLSDIKRFFPDKRASSLRRNPNRDVRKINTWSQQSEAGGPF